MRHRLSAELRRDLFLPRFGGPELRQLGDAAVAAVTAGDGAHLRTALGVSRPLLVPTGELLPRIC